MTLRNLKIEGVGSGLVGINFINGSVVHLENVRISAFQSGNANGIRFIPPSGVTAELFVSDSIISDSGTGLLVQPSGSGSAKVVLTNVQVKNNGFGVTVDGTTTNGGSRITIQNSSVVGNSQTGISATSVAAGPITMLVDKSAISNNGTVGIFSNGNAAFIFVCCSIITGNDVGWSFSNGGNLVTYLNNNLSLNLTSNGTPSAIIAPQ